MAFRITTTTATVGALALIALSGCGSLSESRLDFDNTENVKVAQITLLEGGAGDLVVHTGTVSHVQIKRVVRYRGGEPRNNGAYRLDGTELTLDADCGRQCSVSYDILAPEGVTVRGESGSGAVSLTRVGAVDIKVGSGGVDVDGATGPVRAETGSGGIELTNINGAVTARTGSGGVTGRGLSGGKVDVESGSGAISLTVATVTSVRASTGSGSVELAVPAGSYRVTVDTGSGSKDVQVPHDPSATEHLDVETGSGSVTIKQR